MRKGRGVTRRGCRWGFGENERVERVEEVEVSARVDGAKGWVCGRLVA